MITKVLVLKRYMITLCYHQYMHFSWQNNDNKSACIEALYDNTLLSSIYALFLAKQ